MHYQLFNWWNVLINGGLEKYEASPVIEDLNKYQKPIFSDVNGTLTPTISSTAETA